MVVFFCSTVENCLGGNSFIAPLLLFIGIKFGVRLHAATVIIWPSPTLANCSFWIQNESIIIIIIINGHFECRMTNVRDLAFRPIIFLDLEKIFR